MRRDGFPHLKLTRRGVLAGAGGLTLAASHYPLSFAAGLDDRKLVVIILRGALDGLSLVAPWHETDYYAARPTIALAPPGEANGVLATGDGFGLNPNLPFLKTLWDRRQLNFMPAAMSAYRDRSHFDGQDMLETGANTVYGLDDGWLNRALSRLPTSQGALGLGNVVPLILRGEAPVSNWAPTILPPANPEMISRLEILYRNDPLLSASLSAAIATGQIVGDTQSLGNGYEETARAAGRFLAAEGGPSAAAMSFDGWDTHANQGGAQGVLANNLAALNRAIEGLYDELGPWWSKTAVILATEFGRTVEQNGTGGTDHGTGGTALLFGGAVRGGRMLGYWPGLHYAQLHEGRDVYPANDLRSLFKGVLRDHWGVDRADLESVVFPGSAQAAAYEGLIG